MTEFELGSDGVGSNCSLVQSNKQCDQMLELKVAQFSLKVAQNLNTVVLFTKSNELPHIWATFETKFVTNPLKNSPTWSHWL